MAVVQAKAGASASKGNSKIESVKCVTHEFRVSFPAIFEPKAFEGQEPKYSLVMLFDKKTDLGTPANKQRNSLKQAVKNAAEEKWGPREKWPKNLRMPFRDGDEKADKQGYEGTIFVSTSSKLQPGLVGPSNQPILNPKDFYAGCYARAEVIAFAYDKAGNKGVSFSLQNIQKTRDGEAFSGRRDAASVFDAVEDTSEDASSYDDAKDSSAGDEYDF